MAYFTTEYIDDLLDQLEKGKIEADSYVDAEFGQQTLLQAILNSEHSQTSKINRLKTFMTFGCSPDQYGSSMTAISMAAQGVANGPTNHPIVTLLLDHHEKGHRSDLDILKAASGSLDKDMFETVLKSGKVDTNTTQMKGSHILHHLADNDDFAPLIDLIWKYAPDTNPNPIHRKGYSPLTHALNYDAWDCAKAIAKNPDAKIIGTLSDSINAVENEVVDRYDGDFWGDFPEATAFATENGKGHLLPQTVQDIFLF